MFWPNRNVRQFVRQNFCLLMYGVIGIDKNLWATSIIREVGHSKRLFVRFFRSIPPNIALLIRVKPLERLINHCKWVIFEWAFHHTASASCHAL